MGYKTIFQRYELKYLLTRAQKERILQIMEPYMSPDTYGHTEIRNIYFDTDTYRLIRHSLEKPVYKEKLRLRSYGPPGPDNPVFAELKRKYHSVVYKRRISLPEQNAMDWLCGVSPCVKKNQISQEIDYFLNYYQSLRPAAYLSYERDAYISRQDSDFRVTFDDRILCRRTDLSLAHENWGEPVLPDQMVLMEVKCAGGFPLWMSHALSEEHIFKSSFSKYGSAYQNIIYPQVREMFRMRTVPDRSRENAVIPDNLTELPAEPFREQLCRNAACSGRKEEYAHA